MAEPLKQTTSVDDATPRTARARSERDLGGRSRRPARGQRSTRKPAVSEAGTEPRPQRSSKSSRKPNSGSGSPQRPRNVQAGNGARLIAPIALIVFAIACFAVLSSQGSGSSASTSEKAAATEAAATAAAAKSGPTRSTYTVKVGDSFAIIAEKQGIEITTLQELNPDIDPRALQPGQKLKLK
ncbi:MAG: LysM peptidoglycan-binding domain-containing protein [Solirubrobacterales bacterium]